MRNEKSAADPIETAPAGAAAAAVIGAGAIDQVRELLFGDNKREHESRLEELDRRLEALRDDMNARFASLEATVARLDKEAEQRRLAGIDAIGRAIGELGLAVRAIADERR